jgi:YVTN family beta-propeller protein
VGQFRLVFRARKGGAITRHPLSVVVTAVVIAAVSSVASGRSLEAGRPPDPAARSATTIHLIPTPAAVIAQCRRAQVKGHFRMLCPRALPRAVIGIPGQPPPPLGSGLVRLNARRPPVGVDIGYGAPWERDSGSGWRQHVWRNRPCCFLHFVIQRGAPAPGARPAVLGGRRGRLLPATSVSYGGPYFGNHVRFFFRERGVSYVVTLHSFGNRETTALLGRLIAELRPVTALHAPASPRQGTTVRIGSTGPRAIAAAPGALWVLTRERPINPVTPWTGTRAALLRLDPVTGAVRTRMNVRGEMRGLAANEDTVWVAAARSNKAVVLRIDPKTKRVMASARTGTWPAALAVDNRGVWAVNAAPFYKRGTLVRIDAATNRLDGRAVPLGRAPSGIAVGAGAVWVADALEGTVRRIDPERRRVVATISVGSQPYALAFAAGSLWVTNSDDGTVSRIDPHTNKVVATIRVGRNPYGIAASSDSLWVANVGDGTVSRINARTGHVLETIEVGGDPVAISAGGRAVWVSSNSEDAITRLD